MRKVERQQLIRQLIKQVKIETQEELVALLAQEGVEVTQATISRDIKELNLLKIGDEQGVLHYHLVDTQASPKPERAQKVLKNTMRSIDIMDKMIAIKTVPGNGHALGLLLESCYTNVLFTVLTDDDKILMILWERAEAERIYQELLDFARG